MEVIIDEMRNGITVKVIERKDDNGNSYHSFAFRTPRVRTLREKMTNTGSDSTYISFLLSGGAAELVLEELESMGDKLKLATGSLFSYEAEVWEDQNGKERENYEVKYALPATKMFEKEGWFNKTSLQLSVDALDALTWMKSDEYCYDRSDIDAEEEPVAATATAAMPTDDVPF